MAFKIKTLPRITRPIPLVVEVDGQKEDHSFTATFEVPGSKIWADQEKLETDEGQRALLTICLVDLHEIVGDDGEELPFSAELRDAVIDRIDSRVLLIRAFLEAAKEGALGNSGGPPAHGRPAARASSKNKRNRR